MPSKAPEAERAKPCGFAYHCPLVDERRLFSEAQEVLGRLGVSRDDTYRYLALTLKKWCQRHRALDVRPDLARCRAAIGQAAQRMAEAPRAGRISAFVATLYREFAALERSRARPAEVNHDPWAESVGPPAAF